jgi:hypothetical protein
MNYQLNLFFYYSQHQCASLRVRSDLLIRFALWSSLLIHPPSSFTYYPPPPIPLLQSLVILGIPCYISPSISLSVSPLWIYVFDQTRIEPNFIQEPRSKNHKKRKEKKWQCTEDPLLSDPNLLPPTPQNVLCPSHPIHSQNPSKTKSDKGRKGKQSYKTTPHTCRMIEP